VFIKTTKTSVSRTKQRLFYFAITPNSSKARDTIIGPVRWRGSRRLQFTEQRSVGILYYYTLRPVALRILRVTHSHHNRHSTMSVNKIAVYIISYTALTRKHSKNANVSGRPDVLYAIYMLVQWSMQCSISAVEESANNSRHQDCSWYYTQNRYNIHEY